MKKIDIYDFYKILHCLVYGKEIVFNVDHVCENCSLSYFCEQIPDIDNNIYLCIIKGGKSCFDCLDKKLCDSVVNVYLKNKDELVNKMIDKIRKILKKELFKELEKANSNLSEIDNIVCDILNKHLRKKKS